MLQKSVKAVNRTDGIPVYMRSRISQSVSEYAIALGVIMAVILASQEMIKRSLMGKVKEGADRMASYSEEVIPDIVAGYKKAYNREFYIGGYAVTESPERWEKSTQTDSNVESSSKIKEKFAATFITNTDTNTFEKNEKQ